MDRATRGISQYSTSTLNNDTDYGHLPVLSRWIHAGFVSILRDNDRRGNLQATVALVPRSTSKKIHDLSGCTAPVCTTSSAGGSLQSTSTLFWIFLQSTEYRYLISILQWIIPQWPLPIVLREIPYTQSGMMDPITVDSANHDPINSPFRVRVWPLSWNSNIDENTMSIHLSLWVFVVIMIILRWMIPANTVKVRPFH